MARKDTGLPPTIVRQWNAMYSQNAYHELPWFSPRPYPWVVRAVEDGWFRPGARVLDVGCGAGTNSLYLASRGFHVTGIDVAAAAIEAAESRARRRGVEVEFRVADALDLPFAAGRFGGAIDVGCFHTLPPELRRGYARSLARVLRRGGRHALTWVAREETKEWGPRHRPSLGEVTEALEPEFIFRSTEFWPNPRGRSGRRSLAAYGAILERRSRPQPGRR
jgi:SAM-dependent methyltransferase